MLFHYSIIPKAFHILTIMLYGTCYKEHVDISMYTIMLGIVTKKIK